MSSVMRPPIAPIGWSIALHAVLAGLLLFGLSLPKRDEQPVILPIDAVVVDDAVLQAAGRRRDDDQRAEVEARKRAAVEAEEKRLEEERIEQEQERQQAEERAKEQAKQEAEQKKAKAEADAKLKAEADAKRNAEAKAAADKKRATQDKRDRDAREADLRAKLEEEETRTSAGFQSLKASYVRAIQAHVEQRWYEPPGVAAGLSCTIYVTQIPGGEVTGMRFGTCNGNAAVRQSIETAVRNASPLPAPPEPSLFEREVELVFTPKEN